MNRKILIIILALVVLLALSIFVAVNINRSRIPLPAEAKRAGSISGLIAQAKELEKNNNLLETKNIYAKLICDFPNSGEVMKWQKKVESLNMQLLFSPLAMPKSILYEIKPGDTLFKIAKEFKTTTDLIMKSNNLSSDKIMPGRKIKVWTAPFTIFVDKSENIMILKSDEEIVKTYIVATGANNSTPVGTFKIANKLASPTWFKAGTVVPAGSPDNILGTRWMGFDLKGYGIHGTTDPQNLGKQVTQGCIRMSNSEVEELYMIVPTGTEVIIVD